MNSAKERILDMDAILALESWIGRFLDAIRFQMDCMADSNKSSWDMKLKLKKVNNFGWFSLELGVFKQNKETGKFNKNLGAYTFEGDKKDLEYLKLRFYQVSLFTTYKGYSFEVLEKPRWLIVRICKK
jgi:hypothetical protein